MTIGIIGKYWCKNTEIAPNSNGIIAMMSVHRPGQANLNGSGQKRTMTMTVSEFHCHQLAVATLA